MTVVAAERQACETPHNRPVPAETWSWVFGLWLCRTCLDMRTDREANRIPGARLDRLQRREADGHRPRTGTEP